MRYKKSKTRCNNLKSGRKNDFCKKMCNFAGMKEERRNIFRGDTQTIANHGVLPSEAADALQTMARESIGSREAIWSSIHDNRKKITSRLHLTAIIAVIALGLTLFQLLLTVFS